MKRISIILLLVVYGMSSFGIGLKSFYCCGKLKSVSFNIANFVERKSSKEDGSGGCCKTSYKYFKVKDSHVMASLFTAEFKYFADLSFIPSNFQTELFTSISAKKIIGSHAPPLISSTPVYILHCVYRI